MKIGIIGAGTWGTALANMLASSGYSLFVYSPSKEEVESLSTTRRHKHLDCVINDTIKFTNTIEDVITNSHIVIFATPSVAIRSVANRVKDIVNKDQILVSVAKGIEPDTLFTMSEIIEDVLGKGYKIVALSGPTHAEEVAIGLPTLIVASSRDEEVAKEVQKVFSNNVLRVYTNTDIYGVELCGALKNIIALAAGMSDGMGFGDNAKAAIITRGLAEISRLGYKLGCDEHTFFGLTGIGDIVVTATSRHSRNHNAGELLGKGKSLEETLKEVGMVVEGVNALVAAKQLSAKLDIKMPIVDAVYSVIYEGVDPKEAVVSLFNRKLISE